MLDLLKDAEIWKAVGNNVKTARKNAGLSQEYLAFNVGFEDAAIISYIEHGKRRLTLLEASNIAISCEVSIYQLLDKICANHYQEK